MSYSTTNSINTEPNVLGSTGNISACNYQLPKSLYFDNSLSSYISIPNSASLQVTGAQTWAIWCKLENLSTLQGLVCWRDSATSRVKMLILKRASNEGIATWNNQFQFAIGRDGSAMGPGNSKVYITKGFTTTDWCLFGGSFTANNLSVYLNGTKLSVAVGTLHNAYDGTVNTIYNNTVDPIKIGAANTTSTWFVKGFLDYGVFCNKALSDAEWSELYSKKPGSLPVASDFSFSANIVSLWKIGEDPDIYNGTGGILDSVGTNHGTMINFPTGDSFSTDIAT